jgi:hypothetical protein
MITFLLLLFNIYFNIYSIQNVLNLSKILFGILHVELLEMENSI